MFLPLALFLYRLFSVPLGLPFCKLPLPFLALEKRLYLREQDMVGHKTFCKSRLSLILPRLLFKPAPERSCWRLFRLTDAACKPLILLYL